MKNKIKKSPYANLSQKPIKAPNKPDAAIHAKRLEGGDLRSKEGVSCGK
jgi:hypothetical protein